MNTKVSVSIDVPDMNKAISFYVNALGCKKVRDGAKISQLSVDNLNIYLLEKEEGSNPIQQGSASRDYGRHWTPVHLDFSTADIDQVTSSVVEFGGTLEGSESGDWGAISYCADPFGYGFCVVKTVK